MDKKIDEALETLKTNYYSMQNLLKIEQLDLDRRLEEARKSDDSYDYEEIARICNNIAKHIEVRDNFEYSISVLKFKLMKFEG